MTVALIVAAVVWIAAIFAIALLYVRTVNALLAERALDREERANLINAAKGARMALPSQLHKSPPESQDEPKDLKEYAAIGTISVGSDD